MHLCCGSSKFVNENEKKIVLHFSLNMKKHITEPSFKLDHLLYVFLYVHCLPTILRKIYCVGRGT